MWLESQFMYKFFGSIIRFTKERNTRRNTYIAEEKTFYWIMNANQN